MQFGFIPGSNKTLALISMMHTWLDALDGTGSTVRVALLDYHKAFDLVDHNLLVAKLSNYEIKPTVVNWIADFLCGRTQRVKINSVHSNFLQVPAGIPQGTKIGPWLFLAIINDLCLQNLRLATCGNLQTEIWIIHPDSSYIEALKKAKLETLYDRREKLCVKLFSSIEENEDHKLKELLPPKYLQPNNFRTNRKYNLPKMHTNRFSNSFIPYCARNATL
jgi:hypothetical protein